MNTIISITTRANRLKTWSNPASAAPCRSCHSIEELYSSLARIRDEEDDPAKIHAIYLHYLDQRHGTYMSLETGKNSCSRNQWKRLKNRMWQKRMDESAEGYSAVALNVIKALTDKPKLMILNVPNRGAIPGMDEDAVVETTCLVGNGIIRPFAVGQYPCRKSRVAAMRSKHMNSSPFKQLLKILMISPCRALTIHPLVPSFEIAKSILDDYLDQHGDYFPKLK